MATTNLRRDPDDEYDPAEDEPWRLISGVSEDPETSLER